MVRHTKRCSRKKGGKSGKSGKGRSRGRRQFGGWWKSLIDANKNLQHYSRDLVFIPERKGIDIKYRGEPPNREWLIGGDDKTVGQLFAGAKDGRYYDVIQEIRKRRDLQDDTKGIILNDEDFCALFQLGRLADKYPMIFEKIASLKIAIMCGDEPITPAHHMMTAQRGRPSAPVSSAPVSWVPPHSRSYDRDFKDFEKNRMGWALAAAGDPNQKDFEENLEYWGNKN